jgi:hypothetical protein
MTAPAKAKAPKRTRLVSCTTLLDQIVPKPGLIRWTETQTVKGVATLVRAGEPVDRMTDDEILAAMRESAIGAEGTRDSAARRGVNVHALLEDYFRTGTLPDPVGKVEIDDYGYVTALNRWLIATQPQPLMIEEIVADPVAGYAGRLDAIIGTEGSKTVLWDLKTSERAQAYDTAHLQTRLYARAAALCGDPIADEVRIVVVAKDGEYRDIPCLADDAAAETALAYWRTIKPITAACTSANRVEKAARAEPAPEKAPEVEWESSPDHPDPAHRPGALEVHKRRELPDGGVLEFESAPVGWTTKDGKRRQKPWRAYMFTPPAQGELGLAA